MNNQKSTERSAEPIVFDIERMRRALAGPDYQIPDGMTKEQIVEFISSIGRARPQEKK